MYHKLIRKFDKSEYLVLCRMLSDDMMDISSREHGLLFHICLLDEIVVYFPEDVSGNTAIETNQKARHASTFL